MNKGKQRRGLVQIGTCTERESSGVRFLLGMSGTCLGAAYENMPYLCDKENERSNADIA